MQLLQRVIFITVFSPRVSRECSFWAPSVDVESGEAAANAASVVVITDVRIFIDGVQIIG